MGEEVGEDLEALRKRRMMEIRRSLADEEQRAQAQEQLEAKKAAALKVILTPEARTRLANIKVVKPEFAAQLELQLLQLAQTGRVRIPITDSKLKEVLTALQSAQRKDFTIRRV